MTVCSHRWWSSTILWLIILVTPGLSAVSECPLPKYKTLPLGKPKGQVLAPFQAAQCQINEIGDSYVSGVASIFLSGEEGRLGLSNYSRVDLPLTEVHCACWKNIESVSLMFSKQKERRLIAVEKQLVDVTEYALPVLEQLTSTITAMVGLPAGRPFTFSLTDYNSYIATHWNDQARGIETYVVIMRNPYGDWASEVSIGHLWRPYFEEQIREQQRQKKTLNLKQEF